MIIGGLPNERELAACIRAKMADAPPGDLELYRRYSNYLDEWATDYVRNFPFTLPGIEPIEPRSRLSRLRDYFRRKPI